jgi:hypothetical protein
MRRGKHRAHDREEARRARLNKRRAFLLLGSLLLIAGVMSRAHDLLPVPFGAAVVPIGVGLFLLAFGLFTRD